MLLRSLICTPKMGNHMNVSEQSNTIACFNLDKKYEKKLIISVTSINQIGSFRMLLDRFYWNWLQNVTLYDNDNIMFKISIPSCSFCDISGLCRPNWIHQAACLIVNWKLNPWRSRANHWKEDKVNKFLYINFLVGNIIVLCQAERLNKSHWCSWAQILSFQMIWKATNVMIKEFLKVWDWQFFQISS
jgi:hypothetical protein